MYRIEATTLAPPRQTCAFTHEIFEPKGPGGLSRPVVVHTFLGSDEAQALRYYNAHRKTDVFMRSCDDAGRWRKVTCAVRKRMSCR